MIDSHHLREPTPGASLEGAFGAATLGAAGISLNRTAFTQLNSTLQNLMRGDGTYTLEVRPSPTGSRMVGILDGEETDFQTILGHLQQPEGNLTEDDRFHLEMVYNAVKQGFHDLYTLRKDQGGRPMTPDEGNLFNFYTVSYGALNTILTATAPNEETVKKYEIEKEQLRTYRVQMLGGGKADINVEEERARDEKLREILRYFSSHPNQADSEGMLRQFPDYRATQGERTLLSYLAHANQFSYNIVTGLREVAETADPTKSDVALVREITRELLGKQRAFFLQALQGDEVALQRLGPNLQAAITARKTSVSAEAAVPAFDADGFLVAADILAKAGGDVTKIPQNQAGVLVQALGVELVDNFGEILRGGRVGGEQQNLRDEAPFVRTALELLAADKADTLEYQNAVAELRVFAPILDKLKRNGVGNGTKPEVVRPEPPREKYFQRLPSSGEQYSFHDAQGNTHSMNLGEINKEMDTPGSPSAVLGVVAVLRSMGLQEDIVRAFPPPAGPKGDPNRWNEFMKKVIYQMDRMVHPDINQGQTIDAQVVDFAMKLMTYYGNNSTSIHSALYLALKSGTKG